MSFADATDTDASPVPFVQTDALSAALITIVGVQSVFIGLTQLVFGGANQPIPISIVEAILVMWLCYFAHLLIGPLYTPKKK